ncbi:hypothetical protein CBF90_14405 [Microbacterium sp. AISO3]|uniref:polysaccharide pyruvyl transferase family protein n=1 Tax=Microbacterium sp. AISO3 TaxID=2002831 RepID=UPI000B4D3D35|nr:polysaccharide pyruvyl transferase family protein [Microbacterium sp. AISO3]OWP20257.1 hypothetical protein CBF90_17940 [Microbacterium sp. AISO3]OWP20905.1 hypothetical protein CBF90_14405 [Microbacterium sp. AISO3]
MSVNVVHWNPERPVFGGIVGRALPLRRPLNNFGDLLGPVIVERMVDRLGLTETDRKSRLLAVGSILKLAQDGDVVWGIGANGKSLTGPFDFSRLDVRAVRGPLTRDFLVSRGVEVPSVFGDPGLLVGHLWQRDELAMRAPAGTPRIVVLPNFHDFKQQRKTHRNAVDPTTGLWEVIGAIAQADLVVGSSLHGIVIAESLGVPARLVRSHTEPAFKYDDYFQGTGRAEVGVAATVDEALAMGGSSPLKWDPSPLVQAFPAELWSR